MRHFFSLPAPFRGLHDETISFVFVNSLAHRVVIRQGLYWCGRTNVTRTNSPLPTQPWDGCVHVCMHTHIQSMQKHTPI